MCKKTLKFGKAERFRKQLKRGKSSVGSVEIHASKSETMPSVIESTISSKSHRESFVVHSSFSTNADFHLAYYHGDRSHVFIC